MVNRMIRQRRPGQLMFRTLALAALLSSSTLFGAGIARAATLATPIVTVNNFQFAGCKVTNVGTSEVKVDVRMIRADGKPANVSSNGCNTPLPALQSCSVFLFPNEQAACILVASSSRIRAAMTVFTSNTTLVSMVPATK
jgi:hypothetical protein